jgi:hypothetical protein
MEKAMRKWIARLVYRKWFYGFLAVALWVDTWTDFAEVLKASSAREILSLILSASGAVLVTLVFLDLHFRWPPERTAEPDANRSSGGR